MDEKMFKAFVELRSQFSIEDLANLFDLSDTKAEAFESLRTKFFRASL
jgi:hypothetical protein